MKKDPWIKAGAIVALLAGLGTLGLVMPWNAASKSDIKAVEFKADENSKAIMRIEGKLDIIIDQTKK